jgi:hypothetical protein
VLFQEVRACRTVREQHSPGIFSALGISQHPSGCSHVLIS